jgi:hypothetical protein
MATPWIRRRPVRDLMPPFPNASAHCATPAVSESDVPPAGDAAELLYARGFLLAPHEHEAPVAHWRQVRIDGLWLSYDPRCAFAAARSGHSWVALLGRAIDLGTWDEDLSSIAAGLLRAKATGREALLDGIDRLSGRFAVFYEHGGETYVQSDAAAMRSVFYGRRDGRTYAASHAHLVADQVGTAPSAFPDPQAIRQEHNAYALPGRITPFARVFALTPNTELEFAAAEPRRCFPREDPVPRTVPEAVDDVLPLLQRQIELLAARDPLVVSLTGGLDSRTTLALTRPVADRVDYFTYDADGGEGESKRAMRADAAAAREITAALGLRHHSIMPLFDAPPEPLAAVMDRNSKRVSAPELYATHRQYEGGCRGLHIRSNLYEIARAFYRGKREQPDMLTAEHMARLLTGRETTPHAFAAAFAEFIDAVDFDRAQRRYDPLDLYYWEHRCGVWLAAHHIESDVAFDTFTVFNSRRILEPLLAIPLEERISGAAFVEIIRRTWPELLKFPVNGAIIEA